MPNTVSTPACSSALIRLCAPVTCSLIWFFLVLLVLTLKNPLRPQGSARGTRLLGSDGPSTGAPANYEKLPRHATRLPPGSDGVKPHPLPSRDLDRGTASRYDPRSVSRR